MANPFHPAPYFADLRFTTTLSKCNACREHSVHYVAVALWTRCGPMDYFLGMTGMQSVQRTQFCQNPFLINKVTEIFFVVFWYRTSPF